MEQVEHIYINGRFTLPQGEERLTLHNPCTGEAVTQVRLASTADLEDAVAAAVSAFPAMARTDLDQRAAYLLALQQAVAARKEELVAVTVDEYGGPVSGVRARFDFALNSFTHAIQVMGEYPFERSVGAAVVQDIPLGVVGIITPWNSSHGFICNKLAMAIASGSTAVIKPSELSARQTQLLLECFRQAGLPDGVFNVINGRGAEVGAAMVRHPDIAKISFTGSSAVGKQIVREGADTMKRVTLELGGKSANILLPDVDLSSAIPLALQIAFNNSGQACLAGTRLLVPRQRLAEVEREVLTALPRVAVGHPWDEQVYIGPMVNESQYQRVQAYIHKGMAEGARLLAGGAGRPEGMAQGYFVRPTIFTEVSNQMSIAREEIFGPVLCIIAYDSVEEAIRIANDSPYGLHAYVSSADEQHARDVAVQLQAGRVCINGWRHEPMAPFGGFRQSGLGREFGIEGLRAYLEPRVLL